MRKEQVRPGNRESVAKHMAAENEAGAEVKQETRFKQEVDRQAGMRHEAV